MCLFDMVEVLQWWVGWLWEKRAQAGNRKRVKRASKRGKGGEEV